MLIAIGLMAATAGLMIPTYRQFQAYTDMHIATEHLVQSVRAAQILSQTGKFDSRWGVYFPNGTLYAGEDYASRNSEKDVSFPLPGSIEIDGFTEISFTRVDGLPNITGTACIHSGITDVYRTITIHTNGLLTTSDLIKGFCTS